MSAEHLALWLSLGAAVLFGTGAAMARMGMRYLDGRTGSLISISANLLLFVALMPFYLRAEYWVHPAALWFVLIGLVHPALSLALSFEGISRLGATISATLASTAPLFAAVSAVLVLGEHLTPPVLAGTLAIVAGVMVLSWQGRTPRDWKYWMLLFPLGAAAIRGVTQMGFKLALTDLPSPLFGALVTTSVSVVLGWGVWRAAGGRPPSRAALPGMVIYLVNGVSTGVAIIMLYTALRLGQVVIVSPVVATFPLATLAVSLAFRTERFSGRVATGVLLAVAGVALIAAR